MQQPNLRDRLSILLAALLFSTGGVVILFASTKSNMAVPWAMPVSTTAPQPRLGDLLAIASGVAWACTVIGLRYLSRAEGGPQVAVIEAGVEAALADGGVDEAPVVAGSEGAARAAARDVSGAAASHRASGAAKGALLWGNVLVAVVALPGVMPLATVTSGDAVALLYLGVAQVALAYRFLVRGVEKVPALEASLLILFEPVLNPLWAFLFLAERPGPWALAGAGIIATVTAARALAGARRRGTHPASSRPRAELL